MSFKNDCSSFGWDKKIDEIEDEISNWKKQLQEVRHKNMYSSNIINNNTLYLGYSSSKL